jgi:RNA polymerase sigma factor, sigma-70 family
MDTKEREKMILDHMGLVRNYVYLVSKTYDEDLIQKGYLELIRCVDNFDKKIGVKFTTYLISNIKWKISSTLKRDSMMVRHKKKGDYETIPCLMIDDFIEVKDKQVRVSETLEEKGTLEEIIQEQTFVDNFFKFIEFYNTFSDEEITSDEIEYFKAKELEDFSKSELFKTFKITYKHQPDYIENIKKKLQKAYKIYREKFL